MKKIPHSIISREELNKQHLSIVPKSCPLYYYFEDESETIASQ